MNKTRSKQRTPPNNGNNNKLGINNNRTRAFERTAAAEANSILLALDYVIVEV